MGRIWQEESDCGMVGGVGLERPPLGINVSRIETVSEGGGFNL
jgi:hypothetical protein